MFFTGAVDGDYHYSSLQVGGGGSSSGAAVMVVVVVVR